MPKVLDSAVFLRILREEREAQLRRLHEEIDVEAKVDGEKKKVVSPGLKVRSKGDGTLYTVRAVGRDGSVLIDPRGATRNVSDAELEKEFDLD